MINYKLNNNFKSHIILEKTKEKILTLLVWLTYIYELDRVGREMDMNWENSISLCEIFETS